MYANGVFWFENKSIFDFFFLAGGGGSRRREELINYEESFFLLFLGSFPISPLRYCGNQHEVIMFDQMSIIPSIIVAAAAAAAVRLIQLLLRNGSNLIWPPLFVWAHS